MKTPSLTALLAILTISPSFAQNQPMRGPPPAEQQEHIHTLADQHQNLTRKVELTEHGYMATTTSDDPAVVKRLQSHVSYMKKRLASGAMVRRWDPAFVEMVQHHPDIKVKVTRLDNGIEVVVRGKTPAAVKVAQNHANIVSGFVKEGFPAVQRTHPTALGK